MISIKKIVVIILLVPLFNRCQNDRGVQLAVSHGYDVAKEGAWCWFADPRAIHHENKAKEINNTYIGYIDVHGNIKAKQYDFIKEEAKEVLIRSYFQPDDHNNPTFLILPDERVMIFYSRHTDEPCFYYRISKQPGDITNLGKEFKIKTKNNTTYPSPFFLSDDPDHFYLCWRGINWHPTIAKLSIPKENDQTAIVWGPYQMIQSTASRPYAKYTSNGRDQIMMAYTTGHPDPTMPNWLYFNSIDINTLELKDVSGKVLSKIGKEMHHVSATNNYKEAHSDAVVHQTNLRDWLWQSTIDTKGNPVIAMVEINEDKSLHEYYYTRWTGHEWQLTFIANAGGYFHQSPEIEHCYSGGMAIDDQNPEQIYCSVPVNGEYGNIYELLKYTIDAEGGVSQIDTITKDSEFNNIRPYIILHRGDSPLKLAWMYGNYYDWIVSEFKPKGFCTAIKANFEFSPGMRDQVKDIEVSEMRFVYHDKINTSSYVNLDLQLDTANYGGIILHSNEFQYGIDKISKKPYIQVGNNDRVYSTNVLGSSDEWKVKPRSTDGQWYRPTPYKAINLEIRYENEHLITVLNGAIDQVVEAKGLTFTNYTLGDIVKHVL